MTFDLNWKLLPLRRNSRSKQIKLAKTFRKIQDSRKYFVIPIKDLIHLSSFTLGNTQLWHWSNFEFRILILVCKQRYTKGIYFCSFFSSFFNVLSFFHEVGSMKISVPPSSHYHKPLQNIHWEEQRLRTPNEAFFHRNPKFLCLDRKFGLNNNFLVHVFH